MATLNTAFNIATGALEADQAALNVVSNNVANANTPGYTRQVANFEENNPVTINSQSYGMGTTMTGGISQRSLVLQQALQQQGQIASSSSARLAALQQVEAIFSQTATASSDGSSGVSSGIARYSEFLRFAFLVGIKPCGRSIAAAGFDQRHQSSRRFPDSLIAVVRAADLARPADRRPDH